MLKYIVNFSINNKLIVLLFTAIIVGFGLFSVSKISIGVVPDITNNQIQIITTSKNLSTQDVEKFITYPIELEMANLPGVEEIRSVSKFGLSVVTIVFEEKLGTYLPRQLVAEKLRTATEKIPKEFGQPEMGPITTGLGEIYQYILDVEPKYKHLYSITELRTIQDWIVKRKLSGINGVIEVNTWGGLLKQYEVAINPNRLRAMNISLVEVFDALEQNNSIAGGGYLEKDNKSYFIRGEGLIVSLEDIENCVVTNRNGMPLFIKDIAEVQYGNAIRFGAITANGEGEKVLGQVMMLKNANSNKTIEAVKQRVAEIQKTLPKGVYINGFLDRSELIGKTTFTIAENLILGCLIVIFVVVLLLGNWRSGLVVASVIPLALLFAISLMYIFEVDANLMSLGAIDFGIIIDGAVIIVEFISFQINAQSATLLGIGKKEQTKLIDEITSNSTSKMMNSAIFGQFIIIIIFIPIFSLTSVEGKMFIPMGLTFSFAILGAMLLCFTYVPVISSLFLKPTIVSERNISVLIMNFLGKIYNPSLHWALLNTKKVLVMASLLLISAVAMFLQMGGEFVPTLDEGDFVIQPVIKTGTSLSKTIEITTEIEKKLKKFEEVEDVVTRIGAAEIPTDPMSMEESDVIIKLKPMKSWVNATSKDELANKFKEVLTDIDLVDEIEFTQPIEMRFNELITGVRTDIAIKLFGEDLDTLDIKAKQIKELIQSIDGASDVIVEKTAGLPQMIVKYNRNQIAKYDLTIEEANQYVAMAFAGTTAGSVFDGEKKFDLVVRFLPEFKQDIQNLKLVFIPLKNGSQIPISEIATIAYTTGPAKISREQTKRRVVVGVNVRDRDLESVVDEIKNVLEEKLLLPVGYELFYDGQFQNLQSAKNQLLISVPIALLLIFVFLYFAFSSVKDALLIYTAIPFAAVGGVYLLWMRDLPFSISASVGFIALFGIAVLNGIVLIEHLKETIMHQPNLQSEHLKKVIIEATKQRLRPVLLTATAATLGFLPMAISNSTGAEVQRPLATVVIGGLVSATILTLLVLPVLFYLFNKRKMISNKLAVLTTILGLILFSNQTAKAQSVEEVIQIALKNNTNIKTANLGIQYQEMVQKTSFSLENTNFEYLQGQYNSYFAKDNAFSISQKIELPMVYLAQQKWNKSKVEQSKINVLIIENEIIKNVKDAYLNLQIVQIKKEIYAQLDSVYYNFVNATQLNYALGEQNLLEKITAETNLMELKNKIEMLQYDEEIYQTQLKYLMQEDTMLLIIPDKLTEISFSLELQNLEQNPQLKYLEEQIKVQENLIKVEKTKGLPDLTLGYTNQTLIGYHNVFGYEEYFGRNSRFSVLQVSLGVPLFRKLNVKQEKVENERAKVNFKTMELSLESSLKQEYNQYLKYEKVHQYYTKNALKQAQLLQQNALKLYENGEIDYLKYLTSLQQVTQIKENYFENLLQLHLKINNINYLIGK